MSVRAVVIAHREGLAAEGIAAALEPFPAMVTIGVATNTEELERCAERADAAAVDARIPGARSAVTRLQQRGLRVVVIDDRSPGDDDEGVMVPPDASVSYLASALVPGARAGFSRFGLLSDRERQILKLAAKGMAAKQIAGALGISLKTVEHHKTRAFRKLGVPNQAAAVAALMDGGR